MHNLLAWQLNMNDRKGQYCTHTKLQIHTKLLWMVTIMHSLYHCSNINNRQNLYCGTYVLYKSYHTSQNKINTVHILKAKHFFPHPSHSQCVKNGLNDAIQFSNIRQQYRTSGESGRKLFFFFFSMWILVCGIKRCAVVQCTQGWKNIFFFILQQSCSAAAV